MDDQLTINDLPVECVEEILKWITDRVDRILARFVCKLWCVLIDQHCSAECYQIDFNRIEFDPYYQDAIIKQSSYIKYVDFSKICSIFANSQRKKTTFKFKEVDFKGSEQFWRTKGKGIISLEFGEDCANIPFMEIVEHCSDLKTLTITSDVDRPYWEQKFNNMLKKCIAEGKRNFSVRFLHWESVLNENKAEFVELLSQVFLGMWNVFIEGQYYPTNDELNSLSAAFENLKFLITLSNYSQTFIFDPSSKVPVSITISSIYHHQGFNDISEQLSRYSCDHNHLNTLKIRSKYMRNFKLDNVQELITQYPSLKSLSLRQEGDVFEPLTKSLSKNNIEYLALDQLVSEYPGHYLFTINDAFLQSFKMLKTFKCHKLVFSDFVKLLRELPCLEMLKMDGGTVDVDPVERTISNGRLLELKIPSSFLQNAIVKYDFRNLKTLELTNKRNRENGDLESLWLKFNEHLKHMKCPKLEILYLNYINNAEWIKNKDQTVQCMINILTLFPTLTALLFLDKINFIAGNQEDTILKIINEVLNKMLTNCRTLKKIGYRWHPHILNVLSPSLIQCRWEHGQRVLKIQ